MKTLSYVNFIISILFMACYAYQAVYLAAALLKKQKVFKAKKLHRYGVLIAARNEEAVIAQLIRSVRAQKYPEELIDIFVVADNCTDKTAEIARHAGAIVYERNDLTKIGKGYARTTPRRRRVKPGRSFTSATIRMPWARAMRCVSY